MKEVVFSAKLLPGEKGFCQLKETFTVDFILIGKYLLADSLCGGGATSLEQAGMPSLRQDPEPYLLTHVLGTSSAPGAGT